MPNSFDITPQGADDLRDIAEDLRRSKGLAAALRFVSNAECAFKLIATDLRSSHIDGFKDCRVIYQEVAGRVQVIRVLMGARDIDALLDHCFPQHPMGRLIRFPQP
jgi:plasmid stabilization system protein ParE